MKASLPAQKAGKEAFTAFSAGRLSARFGAERVLPVGYSTAALGAFGFLLLDGSTPYWLAAAVFAGLGVGQSVTPTNIAGLAGLPHSRTGIASATVNAARQTGTTLGVAVLGALIARAQTFTDGLHLAVGVAGAVLPTVTVLTAATLNRAG